MDTISSLGAFLVRSTVLAHCPALMLTAQRAGLDNVGAFDRNMISELGGYLEQVRSERSMKVYLDLMLASGRRNCMDGLLLHMYVSR